jgi:hypothetical protein
VLVLPWLEDSPLLLLLGESLEYEEGLSNIVEGPES